MSEHAIIQPSSMGVTVHCAGSVQAQAKYPQPDTDASREGTAAHWVWSEVLESWKTDTGILHASEFLNKPAPNGVIIDETMIEGAEMYIRDMLDICQADGLLQSMLIEHRVSMKRIHDLNWGTVDTAIWNPAKLHLIVADYKYGFKVVEAKDNHQCIDYAVGVLDEVVKMNGLTDQMITVEIRVIQPRAWHPDGPIRSWVVNASDLRGHINQMSVQSELSQQPDPPTKAGDHCYYCTARHACKTNREAGYSIIDEVQRLHLHDYTPHELGVELANLEPMLTLLKSRVDGLKAQGLELAKKNHVITNYVLGSSRGSTKWSVSDSEVITLGDVLNIDLRKPESPITPKQAMKLQVDEAVILAYSDTHQGSTTLVQSNESAAQKVFGKTEQKL